MTLQNMYINYRDQGDPQSPVLLLIHGLGCSLRYWACVFDAREFANYRILALDLPGFGMSDKPDSYDYKLSSQADLALAFVDALQVQQFLLVGHSMGGAIAILLALKYPDRVKHLVVIEPNLRAHDAQLSREMVKYRESEFIQRYQEFQSIAIDTVKHWFVGFRQRNLDDYIIELLKTTPVSMYRSAQSLIRTTRDETFLTQFQQLTIPKKHFLIGEETLKIRRIPSDFAANNIQTVIVPGVGHMMMVDNPAIFNETLATALNA